MPWVYNKYVGPRQQPRLLHGATWSRRSTSRGSSTRSGSPRSSTTSTRRRPFPARIWVHPGVGADQPERPPAAHPLAEPDRARPWDASSTARTSRAPSRASVFDTLVPGLRHAGRRRAQHHLAADRDRALPLRDAALLHARRLPGRLPRLHRRAFYPSPWKGGWWRLRDAVEYCLTASKAVLQTRPSTGRNCCSTSTSMGKRHDRAVQEGAALRLDRAAGAVGSDRRPRSCSASCSCSASTSTRPRSRSRPTGSRYPAQARGSSR